jgi:hypothetical protein
MLTMTADTKKHKAKYLPYYKPGLLHPEFHQKLVENIERVCSLGRIPALYVYAIPLSKYCDEADCKYVEEFRQWKKKGITGMAYVGDVPHVADRMMAIAGALTRNYVEAKVMSVQELIQSVKDDSVPTSTCILVPNFYLPKDQGGSIPDWQVSMLMAVLMERFAMGLQTVLYIQDLKKMERDYGRPMVEFVRDHLYIVEG